MQQSISATIWPSHIKPTSIVGKRLMKYAPRGSSKYKGYPHEYGFGHYYQGDIILPPQQLGRVALGEQYVSQKWPTGIVPYIIKANFTNTELRTLQAAFQQFVDNSCVRFVPRKTEKYYVTITNLKQGCYSFLGRNSANQNNIINLQTPECMQVVGTPVHEMMHALGFFHEVNRPDRDEYVTLNTTNLRPDYQDPAFIEANFGKLNDSMVTTYGVPYNYGSVMHYSRYAGSIGICCPVIDNIKPYNGDFGSEAGLTPLDIQQLNARKRLMNYAPKGSSKYKGYPHEYGFGYYYQGDIMVPPRPLGRVAISEEFLGQKWPGAIVPYVVEANFTNTESQTLQNAFRQFADKTCIRFVPRLDELHYVTITNRNVGCYSGVGRAAMNQYNIINLQTPECMESVGTPVHELMHALGFFHEFTRPDRDEYVTVNITNLSPEDQNPAFIEANFGKLNASEVTTYGVPYNYGSVMHYSRYAASIGMCCPVLNNIKPYFGDFGSEAGLTPLDIQQLNVRYCNA
ncbi:metalloproteinase [Anopheles darlingi]|uniref:Metalloendopeptidase n=1 Tax=Anopheles darlingi TaxID=43151 RepID=W5JE46_ANODA|nr:metalloproteinase [Anopheles darlingi]